MILTLFFIYKQIQETNDGDKKRKATTKKHPEERENEDETVRLDVKETFPIRHTKLFSFFHN
jgi:hypothetical protein